MNMCGKCKYAKTGMWMGNPNKMYTYCSKHDVVNHETVPCSLADDCIKCRYSGWHISADYQTEYFCMMKRRRWFERCPVK